ncbi:MAG TPA: Maf family protein [Armatimonadota bacterium]|nr:Maf family protein [Armatimonadota bacterium]HOS42942.1 Maf family protein [Armatimonadota bacterium]
MRTLLRRPLVLASASPRRAELLRQIGLDFRRLPAHTAESPPAPGQEVLAWAQQAALDKARAALPALDAPALVLGADTVVLAPADDPALPRLHGGPVRVLGKPGDAADARAMLRALSGREHTVVSAFALVEYPEGREITDAVATRVRFRPLTDGEIGAYVATGEPLDKAGAYGIQGLGAVLVESITGDYSTVVGLPLTRLWQRLAPWRR